ncbi:MAG: bacterioferritin [Deltaproteobacteria bacterium]|nr:bacterioferritin [Deltaproteobacteria bacterium]NIS78632.1 bacterioferritin [Deltaproteobacteria bacterium]
MKGNKKLIATLNDLLSDELTAISQYFLHAELCDNWGYAKIYAKTKERSIAEMKHAEKLIERILFLDGMPVMDKLKKMFIGQDVKSQFQNDLSAELGAVKAYNSGILQAAEAGDNGTKVLLESILSDEEEHVDWLEMQLDQIKQIGLENYLAAQIEQE